METPITDPDVLLQHETTRALDALAYRAARHLASPDTVVLAPSADGDWYAVADPWASHLVVDAGFDFWYHSQPWPGRCLIPATQVHEAVEYLTRPRRGLLVAVPQYVTSERADRHRLVVPQLGTPVSVHVGSDTYPAAVTAINKSGNTLTISHTGSDGEPAQVRRAKDGSWRLWGSGRVRWTVSVGIAYSKTDYSR